MVSSTGAWSEFRSQSESAQAPLIALRQRCGSNQWPICQVGRSSPQSAPGSLYVTVRRLELLTGHRHTLLPGEGKELFSIVFHQAAIVRPVRMARPAMRPQQAFLPRLPAPEFHIEIDTRSRLPMIAAPLPRHWGKLHGRCKNSSAQGAVQRNIDIAAMGYRGNEATIVPTGGPISEARLCWATC